MIGPQHPWLAIRGLGRTLQGIVLRASRVKLACTFGRQGSAYGMTTRNGRSACKLRIHCLFQLQEVPKPSFTSGSIHDAALHFLLFAEALQRFNCLLAYEKSLHFEVKKVLHRHGFSCGFSISMPGIFASGMVLSFMAGATIARYEWELCVLCMPVRKSC